MTEHNTVYLAWQSPTTRDWLVVGGLNENSRGYEFHYTEGARNEEFVPFSGMETLDKFYVSDDLFPLFHNRLLSKTRPEYPRFIKWLGLSQEEATPLNILARSGGIRATDQLQMFKRIEIDAKGSFSHFFFLHGLSHLNESAQKRVNTLSEGEKLFLCLDAQNKYDKKAVLARADNPSEIIGYCPRFFAEEIKELLERGECNMTVETVKSDAPATYRLMVKIEGQLSSDNLDYRSDLKEYQFIV